MKTEEVKMKTDEILKSIDEVRKNWVKYMTSISKK